MVSSRIVTRFFKLDEKRALQVEFHPVGSSSKPGPKKWLHDNKLLEINSLLHDVINQCASNTGKTERKTEQSNQIITGDSVRLGCVFKKSPSHNVLLGKDSDDESTYHNLYGHKLIVYVCPIEPGSPNNGSELYRAMVRAESGSKMMKISTYFSRAGGSGTQGGGTAQTTSSSSSSSTTTSSQDQKEVIRNIMKRGKMAKQSKKFKSSARKKEEPCKPRQQDDTSQSRSSYRQQDDTSQNSSYRQQDDTSQNSSYRQQDDTSQNRSSYRQQDDTSQNRSSYRQQNDTSQNSSYRQQNDTSQSSSYRQQDDTSQSRSSYRQQDDTSQNRSFYRQQDNASQSTNDTHEDAAPGTNNADHKGTLHGVNNSSSSSQTSDVIDIPSYIDTDLKIIQDATSSKCKYKNKTNNVDKKQDSGASELENNGVTPSLSPLGTITLCDISSTAAQDFQPTHEPTITVYSAEQVQDLPVTVKPSACHPDTSAIVSRTPPLPSTSNLHTSDIELGDESNDSILPSFSFIQQKTNGSPDNNSDIDNKENSDVDSNMLFDQSSDTHIDFDSIRPVSSDSDSSSDDNLPMLSTPPRRKTPRKVLKGRENGSIVGNLGSDSDGDDCLIALKRRLSRKRVLPNFPAGTNLDEEIPNKKLKYVSEVISASTINDTFDSDKQTSDALKSASGNELPSLTRSRKNKMSRAPKEFKQAKLSFKGGNLAVTKTQQDTQPEKDREDRIIMEDQASQRLRSDLRREIIHAENVKDLNEQNVRFLVQENRRYLKDIFEGKIPCERHNQYKQGGRTRSHLNYQVYLGLFTDEQQDVVMEALMAIFCKKNHGFLDYVMKVMLPEILIKIYMEVTGLSHDEVDDIMARGGN